MPCIRTHACSRSRTLSHKTDEEEGEFGWTSDQVSESRSKGIEDEKEDAEGEKDYEGDEF